MACKAPIEQLNEEIYAIKRKQKRMEHLSEYIEVLEKRNLFLIRSCNMILIMLFFLFLTAQFFTASVGFGTAQLQQLITSMATIGKWPIAVIIIFLYAYANVMEEGVKT